MPTCRSCEKKFPNRIVIDGITKLLAGRKFCLQCSPYGKHNTSKYIGSGDVQCSLCDRQFSRNKRAGHVGNICNSCYSKKKKLERMDKARELLGNKCSFCGYKKCRSALEFHHRDESKKSFGISNRSGLSWSKLIKELNKCVLLCSNCHREVHEGLASVT